MSFVQLLHYIFATPTTIYILHPKKKKKPLFNVNITKNRSTFKVVKAQNFEHYLTKATLTSLGEIKNKI